MELQTSVGCVPGYCR